VLLEAVDQTAPPKQTEPHAVRRILVAFDGSTGAWAALARAIEIAVAHSALLTIVAVIPEVRIYGAMGPLMLPFSPETLRREAEREMLRIIAAARDEVPANVSLTTQLLHGSPARAIAALAKSGGYDLVVTGPHPCARLRRLLAVE
jgi:nucleotide-binding universal stress UspA family protein